MCEYYVTKSGRRVKRVPMPDFISETQLDQLLMDKYGITQEELNNDLLDSSTDCHFGAQHGEIIWWDDRPPLQIYANESCCNDDTDIIVTNWLDGISSEDLKELWKIKENRRVIGSLIREPGGLHEWLMVAAIPYLKSMGIPMAWVKAASHRTYTDECSFVYYNSSAGQYQQGYHGGPGSGHMHWVLLNYYVKAYEEWCDRSIPAGFVQPGPILAHYLDEFMAQFFTEEVPAPQELENVIEDLRNLQLKDELDTDFLT